MNFSYYSIPNGVKLNLGCGPVQPKGWVNIDGSNRALIATKFGWIDRLFVRLGIFPPTEFGERTTYRNLLNGTGFHENTIAAIYSGELWEHFELQDARSLTVDCFNVLQPGGVLRVCVPDGAEFWSNYLTMYRDELAKERSERDVEKLHRHVQMYFDDICTRRLYFGSMGHTHKWNFDEVQLVSMLEQAGFVEVTRANFHESRIPEVANVERSDFLIVEGVKPFE